MNSPRTLASQEHGGEGLCSEQEHGGGGVYNHLACIGSLAVFKGVGLSKSARKMRVQMFYELGTNLVLSLTYSSQVIWAPTILCMM